MEFCLPLNWAVKRICDENKEYFFDYTATKNIDISPITAALKCIDEITKKCPPPYKLYLSGGVDSQAMLYAWHLSGVPYLTYSAVYNHNLNDHDLVTLRRFSEFHNIKINFVNFNLFEFLEKEHDYYARTYYSGSPQFTSFIKMVESQNEGTAIMSGNFLMPLVSDSNLKRRLGFAPSRNSLAMFHYARFKKKNFIPWFFLETEELAHSFKSNEYTESFFSQIKEISGHNITNLEKYRIKVAYYQSHGFPVLPQLVKYNGFEKVKEWYDVNYEYKITAKDRVVRTGDQNSYRTFDLLYRNKYEVMLNSHKYVLSQIYENN